MLNPDIRKASISIGRVFSKITDSKNVYIRIWFPYLAFIMINFLFFNGGYIGILLLALIDILIGLLIYKQNSDREKIIEVINEIQAGNIKTKVDISRLHFDNIPFAIAVNQIGDGIEKAVETSMKDEKLKADLITNVSHDIKTPLTSIINYIGLIKREDIENEKIKKYVDILDDKSCKLKKLTEDLVDASKISSGNVKVELISINFVELVKQSIGEFYDKFEDKDLKPVFHPDDKNMMILADPRHLWRVIDNLFGNCCKYALPGTYVYMDMKRLKESNDANKIVFTLKNVSASEINVESDDLSERFIRGDESRTTEGSGLGLSIAKNLTKLQGGEFKLRLSCDIFEAKLVFPEILDKKTSRSG